MTGYTVAIVASSFMPAMACIGASIRMALDDRDRTGAAAGFGFAGFFLGIGGLMLVSHIIDKVVP